MKAELSGSSQVSRPEPVLCLHVDREGTILEPPGGVGRSLPVDPLASVGKRIGDVLPPEVASRVGESLAESLRTGAPSGAECSLRQGDRESEFEVLVAPLGGGEAVAVVRDVTERRGAERALRRSEEHFRTLVENSLDVFSILDANAVGIYHSPAIERVLGYPVEEILGTSAFARIHPDDQAKCREVLSSVFRNPGVTGTVEFRYHHKDGSWRAVEVFARTLRTDTASEGAIINLRDVTERKHAEEQLRLQKTLLEAQGEASIDGILVISDTGGILSFNGRFAEMWGIPDEVLASRSDEAALRWVLGKLEDPAAFLARVADLYGHRDERSEEEIRLKDGRVFDRYSAPVKDAEGRYYGRIWWFRDISDRKAAEAALRASEESYRGLFDNLSELVYIQDLEGRFLNVNEAVVRAYGYLREELLHRTPGMLADPERVDVADTMERFGRAVAGEPQRFEWWARRKDGSTFPKEIVLTRSTYFGQEAVIAVARDMTEHKRAEAALQVAKEEAERARESAEAANQAKSEFLSRMSHELRTPMNSILGFAQILARRELAADQRRSVDHILKAGHHLLNLINEVLDLAKIEANRQQLSLEPVRVRSTVLEALTLVRPLAVQHGCALATEVGGDCDHHVTADQQRLTQVLLNLLSNAIKYNRPGGQVRVTCGVAAEDGADRSRFRIRVHDTGYGIEPEQMELLFVPFARLGAEQSGVEGTGLGLALSKRLVEAMGGALYVESTPGTGSTFTIELKRAESPSEGWAQHRGASAAPAGEPDGARKATLLYVEDNVANLSLIETIFADRPEITLVPALQGRLGLDLAVEHRPDLILLDLHLPDIPGEEVLRRLRSEPRTRETPVIVISADATPGMVKRLLEAGAQAYLTKPLDVGEFLETIDAVLRARS